MTDNNNNQYVELSDCGDPFKDKTREENCLDDNGNKTFDYNCSPNARKSVTGKHPKYCEWVNNGDFRRCPPSLDDNNNVINCGKRKTINTYKCKDNRGVIFQDPFDSHCDPAKNPNKIDIFDNEVQKSLSNKDFFSSDTGKKYNLTTEYGKSPAVKDYINSPGTGDNGLSSNNVSKCDTGRSCNYNNSEFNTTSSAYWNPCMAGGNRARCCTASEQRNKTMSTCSMTGDGTQKYKEDAVNCTFIKNGQPGEARKWKVNGKIDKEVEDNCGIFNEPYDKPCSTGPCSVACQLSSSYNDGPRWKIKSCPNKPAGDSWSLNTNTIDNGCGASRYVWEGNTWPKDYPNTDTHEEYKKCKRRNVQPIIYRSTDTDFGCKNECTTEKSVENCRDILQTQYKKKLGIQIRLVVALNLILL